MAAAKKTISEVTTPHMKAEREHDRITTKIIIGCGFIAIAIIITNYFNWFARSLAMMRNDIGVLSGQINELQQEKMMATQTYTQTTVTSGSVQFTGALAYGSTGEQVKRLQQRLTDLGYFEGQINGNYFKVTEGAVKAFQKANGLPESGFLDNATRAILNR